MQAGQVTPDLNAPGPNEHMLTLASLTKSVCVMHCGSADRSVPCRPMHGQASSIRAVGTPVLSAGGLRNVAVPAKDGVCNLCNSCYTPRFITLPQHSIRSRDDSLTTKGESAQRTRQSKAQKTIRQNSKNYRNVNVGNHNMLGDPLVPERLTRRWIYYFVLEFSEPHF